MQYFKRMHFYQLFKKLVLQCLYLYKKDLSKYNKEIICNMFNKKEKIQEL